MAPVSAAASAPASSPPARRRAPARLPIPGHIYAVLFASTSVVLGVLWDISWHSTIGRDTFWSPPHMAIYLGGAVAGLVCGWHVLHLSVAGTPLERAATVTWWKYFRGPLGAWICIWGAIAMLTSGPFDDWWHNAYGLDVKILSPPHAVLAVGILAIQLGAILMVVAIRNRRASQDPQPLPGEAATDRTLRWMYAYAAGLLLVNNAVMVSEYTWRIYQHNPLFYQVACGAFVFPLVTGMMGSRTRWSATAIAAVYTGVILLLVWIFPLFPAEPKLAPIRFPIRQMMPPQYPLLLIVPAMAMDLALQRWRARPGRWRLASVLGALFLVTFLTVQWPFGTFLNSELARNPFFGQHLRPYMVPADSFFARGEFIEPRAGLALVKGLAVALGLAVLGARAGLGAGDWLARVRR